MTESHMLFLECYDETLNETKAMSSAGITIDELNEWKKSDTEFNTSYQLIVKKHYDDLVSEILKEPKTVQDKKLAMQIFQQTMGTQYKRAKKPGKHSSSQSGEDKEAWHQSRKPVSKP